jgi:hypothetical protein
MSTCTGSKHVHVEAIVKIKLSLTKVHFILLYDHIVMHIEICTPSNNKISQLGSPNTFLVSTLTSAISIHPRCPDSAGIIFP